MDRNKRLIDRPVMLMGLLAGVLMLATACADGTAAIAPAAAPGEAPEHTINVSGNGQAMGTPDIAFVQLGVDVTNPDVGQAIAEANRTMDSVRQALIDAGIPEENLQTTNFSVSAQQLPVPEEPTGQQPERTYRVQNILRVKVEQIESVSDVIDAGLGAGANSVYNLSFDIDDPTALQDEARAAAIEDARNRAQQLADGLGVQVGPPVQVSESFGGQPQVERVAMDAAAAGGAPPISQGQLAVNVTVNVSFLIEE
jgi:uncharacterized protein YggE